MSNPTREQKKPPPLNLLQLRFTVTIPLWLVIFFLMSAYLIWEIYWYHQAGYRFMKWHTHIAAPLYVWAIGLTSIYLASGLTVKRWTTPAMLLFSSVMLALTITETILTFTGTAKTYFESQTGSYSSYYKPNHNERFLGWKQNPHYIIKQEFKYIRPTNIEGVGDSIWTIEVNSRRKRIMTLGDSFTEGDGAAYDSTYPSFLKHKLIAGGDNVYMMNAGISGSDPFYNYMQFKERLIMYKPDVVIQTLSGTDIRFDYLTRGGLERFNSTPVVYHKAPWWEPLYAISYTSRLFFRAAGYNELLLPATISQEQREEIDLKFSELFNEYGKLCSINGIKLVVIIRPDENELINGYDYNFSNIISSIKKNKDVRVIDLSPLYINYIKEHRAATHQYYWKLDRHHNALGYEMMADVLYPDVHQILSDTALQ